MLKYILIFILLATTVSADLGLVDKIIEDEQSVGTTNTFSITVTIIMLFVVILEIKSLPDFYEVKEL